MKGIVLGHDAVVQGHTEQGTTLDNEMNFAINLAAGAGLIDGH